MSRTHVALLAELEKWTPGERLAYFREELADFCELAGDALDADQGRELAIEMSTRALNMFAETSIIAWNSRTHTNG